MEKIKNCSDCKDPEKTIKMKLEEGIKDSGMCADHFNQTLTNMVGTIWTWKLGKDDCKEYRLWYSDDYKEIR